jgi:hypothetical protein
LGKAKIHAQFHKSFYWVEFAHFHWVGASFLWINWVDFLVDWISSVLWQLVGPNRGHVPLKRPGCLAIGVQAGRQAAPLHPTKLGNWDVSNTIYRGQLITNDNPITMKDVGNKQAKNSGLNRNLCATTRTGACP